MRASAVLLVALPLLAAAPAAAQPCGEHEVRAGDTLSAIARDAPGAPSADEVFQANRDRLSSPDMISVGQTLRLPCPPDVDGPAEATSPTDAVGEPAPGSEAPDPSPNAAAGLAVAEPPPRAPLPSPPPIPPDPAAGAIRVASGGDAAALPADARARDRLLAALAQGAPEREVEIAPAASQARARIAPSGEADLAFAWIAPDCAALPRLDIASAELCVRYDLSAPLATAQVAWFVREDAAARTPEDLAGGRICRPAGRPLGDIAALGLAPPRALRLAPATAADCLRLLREGEADAAALFVEPAADPGPGLHRLDGLGGPQALVALAHPANPRGTAALSALNLGLAELAGAEGVAPPD